MCSYEQVTNRQYEENKLRIEKEKIINEYIQTNIKTINNIDNVYYSIKNEIEENKDLSYNKKNDNLAILEDIYNIGDPRLSYLIVKRKFLANEYDEQFLSIPF